MQFVANMRAWGESDDGKPVYMINLMGYYDQVQQNTRRAADNRHDCTGQRHLRGRRDTPATGTRRVSHGGGRGQRRAIARQRGTAGRGRQR